MNISRLFISLTICFAIWSCTSHEHNKPIKHQVKYLNGSTNNKLEILDWGGEGKVMLFLAGRGNTGHVFDEFAAGFTDSFHVYALTRRGYGASLPSNGYDMKTLTEDIIAVMDSLHIEKAILVGHSIAGDEMTKLAILYPSRVDKIIYLDAAYDRTSIAQYVKYFPEIPGATNEDSSSFGNYKKFIKSQIGVNVPDEEFRQNYIFSKEGRFVKDVTADSIGGALFTAVEHPVYKDIKCPALAIYAVSDSVQQVFPFYSKLDIPNKQKTDTLYFLFNKFSGEEKARFKMEMKDGIVKEMKGANHYLFISNPEETKSLMREFLR